MSEIILSDGPVTLVGGGPVLQGDLADALALAPLCIAADGGAASVIQSGVMPAKIIGDFDSVDAKTLSMIPAAQRHQITDQDSTDFDKALRNIAAPLVLAVGFSGGRIDHQLAAFHTLLRHHDRPCVILGEHEVVFHCPARIALECAAGDVVSLFPLLAVAGRSTGLRWAIDGLQFAPDEFVGTSNCATGPVELWMDAPGMLCIVPRRMLAQVTQALMLASPHQPEPSCVRAE